MNKIKIGMFLKQLRKEKGMTQSDIIDVLAEEFFTISQKTISDWENGKALPSIEIINVLSKLYNVSITEILEGTYKDTLNTHDETKSSCSENECFDKKCTLLGDVIKYVGEFIRKFINKNYTVFELLNFKEVIQKHYVIYNENITKTFEQNFFLLMNNFNNIVNDEYINDEEKIFTMQKLIMLKPNIIDEYLYGNTNNVCYEKKFLEVFNVLDFFQKDMYLIKLLFFKPQVNNLKYKINLLIENGAILNKAFILPKKKHTKMKVIDTLEEIFNLYIKPLKVNVLIPNLGEQVYLIENTYKNYFFLNYAQFFADNFNCKYSHFYELTKNTLDLCDELIINSAKLKDIDVNRDISLVREEVIKSFNIDVSLPHFLYERTLEKDYYRYLDLYNHLLSLLESGEKYYYLEREENICYSTETFNEEAYKIIENKTIDDLKESRDIELTKKVFLQNETEFL